MASKNPKINCLADKQLKTITPEELHATINGVRNYVPTDEVLATIGKLLGQDEPITLHKWNKMMNGKNTLTIQEAVILSHFLDIPLESFCTLETIMEPQPVGDMKELERRLR